MKRNAYLITGILSKYRETYIEISVLFPPVSIRVGITWISIAIKVNAQLDIRIFSTQNVNNIISEP